MPPHFLHFDSVILTNFLCGKEDVHASAARHERTKMTKATVVIAKTCHI